MILPTLKFIPDWFVKNKMLEKLDNFPFSGDDIDSNIVTFVSEKMELVTMIDLNNINLDDDDFHEGDPKTFVHVILTTWCKQRKPCKKRLTKN